MIGQTNRHSNRDSNFIYIYTLDFRIKYIKLFKRNYSNFQIPFLIPLNLQLTVVLEAIARHRLYLIRKEAIY